MKLFEIDADLEDLRDEIQGMVLAAKAAGIMKVTPEEIMHDLRRSGHMVDTDELLLILDGIPGISTATDQEINFAKTTPGEKQQDHVVSAVEKIARSQREKQDRKF